MSDLEKKQRELVIKIARSWLRTPYQHRQQIRGAGVDCAMFPLAVYHEAGLINAIEIPPYPPDWHLHKSVEVYLGIVESVAKEIFREPQPADFVLYQYGRCWSHGAIVIKWPLVIHSVHPHGVIFANGEIEGCIVGRKRRLFSIW